MSLGEYKFTIKFIFSFFLLVFILHTIFIYIWTQGLKNLFLSHLLLRDKGIRKGVFLQQNSEEKTTKIQRETPGKFPVVVITFIIDWLEACLRKRLPMPIYLGKGRWVWGGGKLSVLPYLLHCCHPLPSPPSLNSSPSSTSFYFSSS